jgi:hypothetical protein
MTSDHHAYHSWKTYLKLVGPQSKVDMSAGIITALENLTRQILFCLVEFYDEGEITYDNYPLRHAAKGQCK